MQDENAKRKLIKLKRQYQNHLLEKLEAVYGQLAKTLNEADKVSLRQDIKDLEKEFQKFEDEIEELNLSLSQRTRRDSEIFNSPRLNDDIPDPAEEIIPIPDASRPKTNINLQRFHFEVAVVELKGFVLRTLNIRKSRQQAWQFIEDLGNGVRLEMVQVPQGNFLMGSPKNELERRDNESPQHEVTVSTFFMGKYPITQAQWQAVANLPQVNRKLEPNPSRFKGANRPVERVSWYDAVEFCARLSQKTGKIYRLPSEAEWEYACRAGTTTPFHFGETITTDLANYRGTDYTDYKELDWSGSYGPGPKGIYREETTPVGSFRVANAFGLYDMHGNVWQWCADPWHSNYQGAPGDGTVWDENWNDNLYQTEIDLLVNTKDDNRTRLLRGGSWDYLPRYCRSAIRYVNAPDNRSSNVGFRVVCVAAWT